MVKIGPWTVTEVLRAERRERCQRCGTSIIEVWCCSVDASFERLHDLDGQRDWRVGNDCGPNLIEVTDEIWNRATKDAESRLRLLQLLDELIAVATARDVNLPSVFSVRRSALIDGTIAYSERRRLIGLVGSWRRRLQLDRARR